MGIEISEASLTTIKALLNDIEPEELMAAVDKTLLGKTGSSLEELRKNVPESVLVNIVSQTITICDNLIIDIQELPTEAIRLLSKVINLLREAAAAPESAGAKVGEAAAALADFTKTLEGGAGKVDPAMEAVIPIDVVNIASEEDRVIYVEFLNESSEHLESIEPRILSLEQNSKDSDLVNEVFRSIHSIKGAAGFLGLAAVNMLCHEMETLLDRARKFTLEMDREATSALLAGIDVLKGMLANVNAMLAGEKGTGMDIRPAVAGIHHVLSRAILAPSAPTAATADIGPDISRLGGKLVAQGAIKQVDLEKALELQKRPLGKILVDMGAASEEDVEVAAAQVALSKAHVGANFIKVDTLKLDSLIDAVGELVIAQSLVAQDEYLVSPLGHQLARKVENLSKIARSLQEQIMSVRMVPLRQTFQKMHRLVRDTALKTKKEAKLIISGEETEIDKTVVEEINDPLVHLLRNAVDHGLEPPEDRVGEGKQSHGSIELRAYHHGGNVVIEVADDGKGLDRGKIEAKAKEKGLLDSARTDISDSEIFSFIMAPGFSTASVTTDISGRGVGLDVVKRNIERLGGRLDIRSEAGKGSTFVIKLPMTMAIMDGMVIRCGGQRYILPTLSIAESVHPRREAISTVSGRGEVLNLRNNLIRLMRLSQVFDLPDTGKDPWEGVVMVVTADDRRAGLVVDELLGQQQVVIKNMGEKLRNIKGVSGGCILGDGRVALILDVAGLLDLSEKN